MSRFHCVCMCARVRAHVWVRECAWLWAGSLHQVASSSTVCFTFCNRMLQNWAWRSDSAGHAGRDLQGSTCLCPPPLELQPCTGHQLDILAVTSRDPPASAPHYHWGCSHALGTVFMRVTASKRMSSCLHGKRLPCWVNFSQCLGNFCTSQCCEGDLDGHKCSIPKSVLLFYHLMLRLKYFKEQHGCYIVTL